MAFVETNPRYRDLLEQQGLVSAEDFLALPAVIVSGHPDRNVSRVTIGTEATRLSAFLKREHRIRWKDRLLNAFAGFGWVCKSHRESMTLRELEQAGIRCPEWLAVAEDDQGRGFLLVRDLPGAVELRSFLRDRQHLPARARDRFARRLGAALAQVHNSGWDHPDLYSKHILVDPESQAVCFLDWQRTCRRQSISWRRRWRDLAALAATVSEELASPAERLVCLRAYLRQCRVARISGRINLLAVAFRIFEHEKRLLRRRRIRDLRRLPLPSASQGLIWLKGEELCVTPEFQAELNGQVPPWLLPDNVLIPSGRCEVQSQVYLHGGRRACLVRRRQSRFWGQIWAWLRRRKVVSPELRQAGRLFRQERSGISGPRLLAVGQRWVSPWWVESFLLTEPNPESTNTASPTRGLPAAVGQAP
jgi:tRNA A-37 threonylcarbamoyl transferase component Bud32